MNLSKKTFVYSAIILGTMVSLMVAYFILMLPSLYVDYIKKGNLNGIKEVQDYYIKEGNYDNITTSNPIGTATIRIPSNGNEIYFTNKVASIKIMVHDDGLLNILDKVRYYSTNREEIENIEKEDFELTFNIEDILKDKILKEELPISFEFIKSDNKNIYKQISSKFHVVSDDMMIYESDVSDGKNYYTNYMAISLDDKDIIVSVLTVMTPKIQEIRPIIIQSLPMIIAIGFLIILVAAIIFSRNIVNPIEKLVNHAVFIKENNNLELEPMEIKGQDEIAVLGMTLNDLYLKLNENFKELDEKNKSLAENNKRQEVFLRASSHQLKTPVAAALLLVDGMINEIGKYKNTKEYLPQVKYQLQSMRKIIDEILNLNNSLENIKIDQVNIGDMIDEILLSHEVHIRTKGIVIEKEYHFITLSTDRKIIYKIIDNLINNAIKYTPTGESIKISISQGRLVITNYGAQVESELLPHIFDPFVSGNSESRGHGLGLYIVSYYAKLLSYQIKINNVKNGVEGTLYFSNLYQDEKI